MPHDNHHIVPHKGNWAIQRSGGERPSHVVPTQGEAIVIGREISRNQHTELVIQGKNGRIREKDSHGKDSCPPRG